MLISYVVLECFPERLSQGPFPPRVPRLSVSPCHHQHLILSIFLIFAILMNLKHHFNLHFSDY